MGGEEVGKGGREEGELGVRTRALVQEKRRVVVLLRAVTSFLSMWHCH